MKARELVNMYKLVISEGIACRARRPCTQHFAGTGDIGTAGLKVISPIVPIRAREQGYTGNISNVEIHGEHKLRRNTRAT